MTKTTKNEKKTKKDKNQVLARNFLSANVHIWFIFFIMVDGFHASLYTPWLIHVTLNLHQHKYWAILPTKV